MKNFIFLFILSVSCYSQRFSVSNKSNNTPISYATVQFIKDTTVVGGSYSDKDGLVSFNKKIDFNRIKISFIGFKTEVLNSKEIPDIIFMEPETIYLNEIVVKNKTESDFLNINFINEKSKPSIGFGKGYEIGVFIENKEQKIKDIHSVLLKIFKSKREITEDRYFRIHFYSKNGKSELPGDEILIDNIIYYVKPEVNGLIAFDVSKYNLQLPLNGFFVSVENLGFLNSDKNDFLNLYETIFFEASNSEIKKLSFLRSIFNKYTWYDFTEKLNIINSVKKKSKKQYNVMIGLKVYKE